LQIKELSTRIRKMKIPVWSRAATFDGYFFNRFVTGERFSKLGLYGLRGAVVKVQIPDAFRVYPNLHAHVPVVMSNFCPVPRAH